MQQLLNNFGILTTPLEVRHQPSGSNTLFNGDHLSFTEYVAKNRDMLSQVYAQLNASNQSRKADCNAPFELKPPVGFAPGQHKPYQRGVLLTHGLAGSPYSMRYLAEFFQENGFRVMVILLPGHGTQPGDMLEVDWKEWAKTIAYATDRLAEEVDEVYLAGYSVGGALSICQSLRDSRVRGLFLFSPAIQITRWAAFARLHRLYSWLMPYAKWVNILPDHDNYKYESFTKNAATQTYALTRELRMQLQQHEINIPIFAVASEDDVTVKTSATVEFMARARHPYNKLVLYTTEPDGRSHGIPPENMELLNSVVAEQKILSSSHLAIVLPASDAYYGAAGEYVNCVHYYPDEMEKYVACMKNDAASFQGEITDKNLQAGILRRSMYNPHFAELKTSMKKFIDNLSQLEERKK